MRRLQGRIAYAAALALLWSAGGSSSVAAPSLAPSDPAAQRPPLLTPPYEVEVTKKILFTRAGRTKLYVDLYQPQTGAPGKRPCVLYFHGGAWRHGDRADSAELLRYLAARGLLVASADYRLSGKAPWPAQVGDCKAAVRWLRLHGAAYGGDTARIGVLGGSAGGHLAALLGTSNGVAALEGDLPPKGDSSVQAVADWFGPTDLTAGGPGLPAIADTLAAFLGGSPWEAPEAARAATPQTYVDAQDPPFLIVHGTLDAVVPIAHSYSLRDALMKAGVPVTLIEVPGGGHGAFVNTTPDIEALAQATAEFFLRELAEQRPVSRASRLRPVGATTRCPFSDPAALPSPAMLPPLGAGCVAAGSRVRTDQREARRAPARRGLRLARGRA